MDSVMGPLKEGSEKSSVECSAGPGLLLVPWTRHILAVLWEQVRLLAHVIYYSFLAVFQMFRLEVHLRITDETGRHVQHVSAAGNAAETFILSSLFDGGGGGGGGGGVIATRTTPLASCGVESRAGALFSTLRGDELCCSLVDDFVLRAAECLSEPGGQLCLGECPSWTSGDSGNWDVLLPGDPVEACHGKDASEDAPGSETPVDSFWDDDDDDGEVPASEDNQALWESFTKSSDPYNPFNFSACISSCSPRGTKKEDSGRGWSLDVESKGAKHHSHNRAAETRCLDIGWDSESDWESSSDWEGSSSSDAEGDTENEKLWELFVRPADPYNPMNFTACASSSGPRRTDPVGGVPLQGQATRDLVDGPANSEADKDDGEGTDGDEHRRSDDDELWNSFSQSSDPYHPLCFRACLRSSPTRRDAVGPGAEARSLQRVVRSKPSLPKRQFKHRCPQRCPDSPQIVPWRKRKTKPGHTPAVNVQKEREPILPKVRFSPVVEVHVMRSWSFALQATRRGPWEEMARDRDRFKRRIAETEQAIGYCLLPSHREKILARLREAEESPHAVVKS
ncbi:lisH domain-containing protein C1711.05-like [Scleropages formosus]|uniref:LisH domain-containing protein C1711.05-like n=1 Tax=Scleropages formosus TaxID=113540 RepID=A0A0P7UI69_SCLFO|nr:lisH domain-containing protein C1711.05-like [Scleropages formosus]